MQIKQPVGLTGQMGDTYPKKGRRWKGMFPWNFFGGGKSPFDPFSFFNDRQLQELINQMSTQPFPDFFQNWINGPDKKHGHTSRDINIKETIFETHDDIYIRIPIKDKKQWKNIKIYYNLNKCIITGLTDSPYKITLPATVKKKGAKAIYKDHVLEIKLPKTLDWPYTRIDVEEK